MLNPFKIASIKMAAMGTKKQALGFRVRTAHVLGPLAVGACQRLIKQRDPRSAVELCCERCKQLVMVLSWLRVELSRPHLKIRTSTAAKT